MKTLLLVCSIALMNTLVFAKCEEKRNIDEIYSAQATDGNGYSYSKHTQFQKHSQIENLDMAYLDEGKGPAILLTHGVPTSSWLYRKIVPLLVKKGFRVIAPDMVGFGCSQYTKDRTLLSAKAQGVRMLKLMESLKISKWTQVVHDMSGPVAWEMLELAPEKIDSFVLLNTFAYKDGFRPPANLGIKILAPIKWFYHRLMRTKKGFITKVNLKGGLTNKKIVKEKGLMEGYQTPIRNGAHFAIMDFLTSFKTMRAQFPRYQETLRSNTGKPTLVIWGEDDKILKAKKLIPQFSKDLAIPSENINILKNAKHFIQEEKPKKIVRLISKFLK